VPASSKPLQGQTGDAEIKGLRLGLGLGLGSVGAEGLGIGFTGELLKTKPMATAVMSSTLGKVSVD
jgi:hypothetical protein